jgi:hypothetical protein
MEGDLGILPFFITRSESSMIGKFLLWLQELIKYWIRPATSTLISGILSDLTRSRIDLVV